MKLPRRWLFLPILLLICGVLVQQVFRLRHMVEASQGLVLALTHTSAHLSQLEVLEWVVLHRPADDKARAVAQLDAAEVQFKEAVDRLLNFKASEVDVMPLAETCWEYDRALRTEMALLQSGDTAAAEKQDEEKVDPSYERLTKQLSTLEEQANAAVHRSIRQANIRLGVLAVIGISLIGGLVVIDERQRIQKRALATQREALAYSERRFRLLTERASDVVLIVDTTGAIQYASPSIESVLGVMPDNARSKSMLDLVFPDDRPAVAEHLNAAQRGNTSRLEFRALINSTAWIYVEAVARDLSSSNEIGGVVVNLRDIDDQKRAQTQLLHTALHDSLTGLPNRLMFSERLEAALERLGRAEDKCVAVLFIDIDDFKVINDSVGHQLGDLLIIEVARRLSHTVRRGDTISRVQSSTGIVARLGGDEFTVMLDEIHDATDAVRVCERIHAAMREPFQLGGGQFYASVSIGIAVSHESCTAEDLLRNADVAVHRAKTRGKARYAIYDSAMHERVIARLKLETDLRLALDNNEFVLHYQPIVSLKTGRIVRVEALIRWQHEGRLVLPGEFIPAAEDSGLIRPIGDWALREGCRQAALWNKEAIDPVIVCVNISGKQFTHPTFLDEVMSAIADSGVQPQHLEFEITEGVAMEDAEKTRYTLGQLRAIGVHLALDDFGTGYSSLSYLRRFAVNTLKIDRSFVADLPTNRENLAIVQTIIELARILGLETVAEGIETPEQLTVLQQAGCAMAQGYLLVRPEPAQAPPWPGERCLIEAADECGPKMPATAILAKAAAVAYQH